ncbi:MAG: hypothetical protein IRZ05_02610 [Micromonosporaceae bacterium]|jgi:hypothetical protein|nr:hypothetical protein [Micromonosporaceae bacterium]
MPDAGRDLGVDKYELWLAGKEKLPAVVALYDEARRRIESTGDNAVTALTMPSVLLGNHGEVLGSWTALRDELLTMLSNTATSLAMVADVLVMAADAYDRSDQAAAREFNQLRMEHQDRERHREASR